MEEMVIKQEPIGEFSDIAPQKPVPASKKMEEILVKQEAVEELVKRKISNRCEN